MAATKSFLAILAASTMLGGCSLIPDFMMPAAPTPTAWPTGDAYQEKGNHEAGDKILADIPWQEFFRSQQLRNLIQASLENNRDLRVAALNVETAQATLGVNRANLFPQINAGASRARVRTPYDVSSSGRTITASTYSTSLGFTSFELDLFGRLRSLEAQALEQLLATEETRNTTQLSLIAQVADAYLTLLADQKLLGLTQDTLATQEESFALVQTSFDHGIGSRLDVTQAQTSVETARANLAQYRRQVAQDRNALELLVGRPLKDEELKAENLDSGDFLADLPAGLPSDVMLRRPDIRSAEHSLLAANANIGAARAAFFPSISLTGTMGTSARSLSRLFEASSGAWTFTPAVSVPIFTAGKTQAELDSAKASREIAVAQYEKYIQTAFKEVADGLAARGTMTEQLNAQKALVAATQESYDLSQARYKRGISSYLDVLDSQRSLYSAQQSQISLEQSRLSNLVTLYKALGGGFSTPADAQADASEKP